MRLSSLTAILTSLATCVFTRTQGVPNHALGAAASTFERRLDPDVFRQFMRPCSLIERMDKSRRVGAVGAVDPNVAPVLANAS